MTNNHIEHETIKVRVGDRDWRVSSYSIDDDPKVSAHYSSGGMTISHYWTSDEARAMRDAIDRALAALPGAQLV